MEENEEPNLVIPRPFPHEPLETLERSLSLDVTPEREPVKRSRVQRKKNRLCLDEPPSHPSAPPAPSRLSAPQLNSTGHIYNKIRTLKQAQGIQASVSLHDLPTPSSNTSSSHLNPSSSKLGCPDVGDLTAVANQRALKEVNVPWKIARYKDLVPVNVSEESFQKLTFKPHSVQRKLKPASVDKPRLADLLVPSLESEEADWSGVSSAGVELDLKPTLVESTDVFALHSFMKSL